MNNDIINIKHFDPKMHPRMSMENRAAQFAPFAALNGFYDAIEYKGRIIYNKKILSSDDKNILDNKINIIRNNIDREVIITYFNKDKYISKRGYIKKIDNIYRCIIFRDRTTIHINDIIDINLA